MKIGIMSMQRIVNYGSWLQAYALKKIINSIIKSYSDSDIQFVDYHIGKSVHTSDRKIIKDTLSKLKMSMIDSVTSYKSFAPIMPNAEFKHLNRFRSIYLPGLGVTRHKNYNPELDLLIIGSDEVFNCLQTNPRVGYSKELFGQNQKAKVIATYAGSFGNTTIEGLRKYGKYDEVASWLKKIDILSVRDLNSYQIINKAANRKPDLNLDPVLMYDFSKEIKKAEKHADSEILNSKYMIVYCYANRLTDIDSKSIIKYANEKKLKVVAINEPQVFADHMVYDSPLNILAYFNHAQCVVTDTFHGTIFSVINKKPFATIVRTSENGNYGNQEKLHDLLNRLELCSQEVSADNTIKNALDAEIDYEKVSVILNKERQHTREYLKHVIEYTAKK